MSVGQSAHVAQYISAAYTRIPIVDRGRTEPILQALGGLPFLVEEISLPPAVAEKLPSRCQELNRQQIPAHLLTASLIGTLPERLEDIVSSLRTGLTSSDIEMAHDAAESLVKWLERSKDPELQIPAPPEGLIREIGIAIASRRIPALVGALRAATWIFGERTTQQQETISNLVQDGMNFIALELHYGQECHDEAYIPLLRLLGARLTVAMAKTDHAQVQPGLYEQVEQNSNSLPIHRVIASSKTVLPIIKSGPPNCIKSRTFAITFTLAL